MSGNTEMLGVKVKPETKEQISELIDQAKESGMIEYNGDIYDLFVQNFAKDELAKKMSYGADLKEMQQITSRITDIFINLAQRNDTNLSIMKEDHAIELQNQLDDLTELKEKQKELQALIVEKDEAIEQLTSLQSANDYRVIELEKLNVSYVERIEEQKVLIEDRDDKISIKNELISEKEEDISNMKEDIAENQTLKGEISTLYKQIDELQRIISNKEEEISKQKDNLEFECQKRVFEKREELAKEREEQIANIRKEHHEEIKQYQGKYEELLHSNTEINNNLYELKLKINEKDQYIASLEAQLKNSNDDKK